MANGYQNDPIKKLQQVPMMSLAEYEVEVAKINAANKKTIEADTAKMAELSNAIQSKLSRLAHIDAELADKFTAEKQRIEALVTEATHARDRQTKETADAHELYEQALKDAENAKVEKTAVESLRRSLETEQAVLRARLNDFSAQTEALDEKRAALAAQESNTAVALAKLEATEQSVNGKLAQIETLKSTISTAQDTIERTRVALEDERIASREAAAELVRERELLAAEQAKHADFKARLAAVEAKEAGFAEIERRLVAQENRVKLDVSAVKSAQADLDRRMRNVESREAELLKKLN